MLAGERDSCAVAGAWLLTQSLRAQTHPFGHTAYAQSLPPASDSARAEDFCTEADPSDVSNDTSLLWQEFQDLIEAARLSNLVKRPWHNLLKRRYRHGLESAST